MVHRKIHPIQFARLLEHSASARERAYGTTKPELAKRVRYAKTRQDFVGALVDAAAMGYRTDKVRQAFLEYLDRETVEALIQSTETIVPVDQPDDSNPVYREFGQWKPQEEERVKARF